MNGAAIRLLALRTRTESDMRLVLEVNNGLGAVQHALNSLKLPSLNMQADAIDTGANILRAVYDDLSQSAQDKRGLEQLAGPKAWRLLATYDEVFVPEFLENVDPNLLRMALGRISEDRKNLIRGALCDEPV